MNSALYGYLFTDVSLKKQSLFITYEIADIL